MTKTRRMTAAEEARWLESVRDDLPQGRHVPPTQSDVPAWLTSALMFAAAIAILAIVALIGSALA